MKTTIKELAILFLIGFAFMVAIFRLDAVCVELIGAAIFSLAMYGVVKFLYPDNDLDERIDL